MKVREGTLIDLKPLGFLWVYTGEWERQHNRRIVFIRGMKRGADERTICASMAIGEVI
jgi:hypothetical protein